MAATAGSAPPTGAQILQELAAARAETAELKTQLARAAANRDTGATPWKDTGLKGAPNVRTGESIMSSRGFQFGKLIGATMRDDIVPPERAKIELMMHEKLCKAIAGRGYETSSRSSVFAPLDPDLFSEDLIPNDLYCEMKSLLVADSHKYDPDEARWWGKKAATAATPSMSWVDQSAGGSFVAPPTFGPPIELLRNKEALLNAGATTVPLGPSGRMILPRLTAATQGGWQGENTVTTPVNAGTGSLNLSAKKVIAVVSLANELLRFGSPTTEAMIRADIFKTVALIMDKGLLDGPGSDKVPLGLVTMGTTGVVSTTAGTISSSSYGMVVVNPTGSNQLAGQDLYNFLSGIEENNGEPTGWIMRPQMAYGIFKSRWTPYSGGTSQGGFLFDLIRGVDGTMKPAIAGLGVTKTPQVSNTRGSGSNTYILSGDWPDYLVAMFGAIEFAQTDQGFNLFSADQTLVRAILSCDGAPQHPGLFSIADNITYVVAG